MVVTDWNDSPPVHLRDAASPTTEVDVTTWFTDPESLPRAESQAAESRAWDDAEAIERVKLIVGAKGKTPPYSQAKTTPPVLIDPETPASVVDATETPASVVDAAETPAPVVDAPEAGS